MQHMYKSSSGNLYHFHFLHLFLSKPQHRLRQTSISRPTSTQKNSELNELRPEQNKKQNILDSTEERNKSFKLKQVTSSGVVFAL